MRQQRRRTVLSSSSSSSSSSITLPPPNNNTNNTKSTRTVSSKPLPPSSSSNNNNHHHQQQPPPSHPRASNPLEFQRRFAQRPRQRLVGNRSPHDKTHRFQNNNVSSSSSSSSLLGSSMTVADYLQTVLCSSDNHNDQHPQQPPPPMIPIPIPTTDWIQITGTSPMSSLDAVLHCLTQAFLHQSSMTTSHHDGSGTGTGSGGGGIVNLDAPISSLVLDHPSSSSSSLSSLPLLDNPQFVDTHNTDPTIPSTTTTTTSTTIPPWIKKALVMVSPYARPCGWKIQLHNRSLVYALLHYQYHHPNSLTCGGKPLTISEWKHNNYPQDTTTTTTTTTTDTTTTPVVIPNATLRVENVPDTCTALTLLHLFGRYELVVPPPHKNPMDRIVQWQGRTSDGKIPPTTWLVTFASEAWARTAYREKQHAMIGGRNIQLAHYPQQIL